MKKLLALLLAVVICIPMALTFTACGEKVQLCFIALKNNDTGFTTSDDDTAVAIGLKKGSPLCEKMNEYLKTLTAEQKTSLMTQMNNLVKDKKATYTPAAVSGDTSNGTLKVGMECGYEPFNWTQSSSANGAVPIKNVNGQFVNGYDVQIAAQVASYLNMKLEIYMYDWEGLIPAVKSGTLDAIIAGMSPTAERKEEIDFTLDYYQSNLVIITREGSKIVDCKSLAELDVEGIKIAAQPGTFHLKALQEQTHNLTVVYSYEDFVAMKIALEKGTIDGYVAEEPTALAYCG